MTVTSRRGALQLTLSSALVLVLTKDQLLVESYGVSLPSYGLPGAAAVHLGDTALDDGLSVYLRGEVLESFLLLAITQGRL